MKTSLAAVLVAVLAGCASQSGPQSSSGAAPAPAPAPAASASGTQYGGPSSSVATSDRVAPNARSVYYDFDRSEIKAEGVKVIQANAQYLRNQANKVRVEGNADERGSREYNLALGQRRAEAVAKRMELLGIPSDRIEAVSYGKEKPKATGHDEASWSENRRSDIVYR
jgi:peptidoglycan-associated lipoprotein